MKEIDIDQIAWDAFENPAELYRIWKEEENLLAGQFLANKSLNQSVGRFALL